MSLTGSVVVAARRLAGYRVQSSVELRQLPCVELNDDRRSHVHSVRRGPTASFTCQNSAAAACRAVPLTSIDVYVDYQCSEILYRYW